MFCEDLDRYDGLVNPLKPWRSAALAFVLAWAAVLTDVLDLPIAGRLGRQEGFDPLILLFPFGTVVAYLTLWTVWRIGMRRQRRRSRALREQLQDRSTPPAR